MWRMPTRVQAIEILQASRAPILELIEGLEDSQMKTRTVLGGGEWSVKDLLGHLAGYEEDALAIATGRRPRHSGKFDSVDERNAADLERRRKWSVKRVRDDLEQSRVALIKAIEILDDKQWSSKIQTKTGRSALGLVLGRLLVGDRHGLFAHDLAHLRDLQRSIKQLKAPGIS
jgi:uncharacterized protein (TIGR03083 family)